MAPLKSKPNIFLSYGRGDDHPDYDDPNKSFMRRLYNSLVAAGFTVWWDRTQLGNDGRTFLDLIREGVSAGDKVVFVVGKHAIGSEYVRAEWEYALSICIPVIPILRNGDFNLVPKEIALGNAPDFRDLSKYDDRLTDLIRILSEANSPLGSIYGVGEELPRGYIKRTEDIEAVDALIRGDSLKPIVITPSQRSTSVYGIAGIGKTILARALAQECNIRRRFPDGIIWVNVGPEVEVTLRQAEIGAIFGDDLAEYKDPEIGKKRLLSLLKNKSILLILDDVWNKADAEAFRVGGQDCRLFITTRSQRLAGQIDAKSYELGKLSVEQGLLLIKTYLTSDKTPSEQAYEDYYSTLVEIIEFLDGHTYAISLVAGQLRERGLAYAPRLLERLKKGKDGENPFHGLNLNEEDINPQFEKILWLSYENLGGENEAYKADWQRRFRALGILAPQGTFSEDFILEVWKTEQDFNEEMQNTEDALNDFCQASLLSREVDGRYSQHTLINRYANALLKRMEEDDKIFNQYAEYLVVQLADYIPNTPFHTRQHEWKDIDDDLPQIIHLGNELIKLSEGGTKGNLRMVLAYGLTVGNIYRTHQHISMLEWMKMCLQATRTAQEINKPYWGGGMFTLFSGYRHLEGLFLHKLAGEFASKRDFYKAIELNKQALAIFKEVRDRQGISLIQSALASLSLEANPQNTKEAGIFIEEAEKSWNIGFGSDKGSLFNSEGLALIYEGKPKEALVKFEEALKYENLSDKVSGKATIINNLGLAWDLIGDKQKALDYYMQALTFQKSLQNKNNIALGLYNVGNMYLQLGDYQKSIEKFEESIALYKELENSDEKLIDVLISTTQAYESIANLTKAIHYLELCIRLETKFNHPMLEAHKQRLREMNKSLEEEDNSMISQKQIGFFVDTTITMRTFMIEAQEWWIQILQEYYRKMLSENYFSETVFIEALLQIMEKKAPNIPPDNPYTPYVTSILEEINTLPTDEDEDDGWELDGLDDEDYGIDKFARMYLHEGESPIIKGFKEMATPEETIQQLMTRIRYKAHKLKSSGMADMLPRKEIQYLIRNTYIVKTSNPKNLKYWRGVLKDTIMDPENRTSVDEMEFVTSLLNIVTNEKDQLNSENPYFLYVKQLKIALQSYESSKKYLPNNKGRSWKRFLGR